MTDQNTVVVETLPAPPIPAYQSKTTIAACVTVLASLLGMAGIYMTEVQIDNLTKAAEVLWPLVVTLISGLVTIWTRRKADAPIKGGPADPQVVSAKLLRAKTREARRSAFNRYGKGR